MPPNVTTAARLEPEPCSRVRPLALVVIVSSVGSGDDITHVLCSIPRGTPAAFLVFADVRRGFTRLLCERLRPDCSLEVNELGEGRSLSAGQVIIVPAQCGVEMHERTPGEIRCDSLNLDGKPSEMATRLKNFCRVAGAVFGSRAIAVMLSGMAGDGLQAVSEIKSAGGRVITIDESSALVQEGPRAVVQADLADAVLPLWAVGARLGESLDEE